MGLLPLCFLCYMFCYPFILVSFVFSLLMYPLLSLYFLLMYFVIVVGVTYYCVYFEPPTVLCAWVVLTSNGICVRSQREKKGFCTRLSQIHISTMLFGSGLSPFCARLVHAHELQTLSCATKNGKGLGTRLPDWEESVYIRLESEISSATSE